jgi:hypothetical protein
MSIAQLRQNYHHDICEQILALSSGIPNIADKSSTASIAIAQGVIQRLNYPLASKVPPGQRAGTLFEQITSEFLEQAFKLLHHLRPGEWHFSVNQNISTFEQYEHLADIQRALKENPELAAALGGDYLVTPDIVVGRQSVPDAEINSLTSVVAEADPISRLTPLREVNRPTSRLILHASISCKWTIRSDRAQNIRTEALNLIRNRKGHIPHLAVVTAEPLPTRLASLALGTGDLDCAYHFALAELQEAVEEISNKDQLDMLLGMINGRRLRDISDLPFDLAT